MVSVLNPRLGFRRFASFYDRSFLEFAKKPVKTITLQDLTIIDEASHPTAEQILQSARAVHATLPIRLARRIIDIHHLPYIVGTTPSIQV